MSDDEVNESTVRVSLRIPARMVDRIDEIRGPYRDRTSMILEMIGTYLDEYDVREKERIAQGSEEYQWSWGWLSRRRRAEGASASQPPP